MVHSIVVNFFMWLLGKPTLSANNNKNYWEVSISKLYFAVTAEVIASFYWLTFPSYIYILMCLRPVKI